MTRIDEKILFRKPFSEVEKQLYFGEPKYLDSPNKKYYLTFSHFAEPRMGVTISLFNLVNSDNEIIERFEPLVALGNGYDAKWSENSNYFVTPLITCDDNYFIYNIERKEFAVIPVENAWILDCKITDTLFEIEYEESQIPDREEQEGYPTKEYLKPENFIIELSRLNWYKLEKVNDFESIYKAEKIIKIRPIDKGFRQFNGEYPKSTERTVWDIERFAEYGDEISAKWMEEIKSRTSNDYYRWEKASKYIGLKKRK